MVNRREFLATAMATSGVTKLAESMEARGTAPFAASNGPTGNPNALTAQPFALPPGSVKVGGEMGRRIDVTVSNNLLALDADKDFLQPLRDRNMADGYWGLGKLIDASVRFSLYTRDERVLAFKQRLVAEVLKTQEKDGYIGYLRPDKRIWALWDISEAGYIVYGLTMDHRFYGETASLEGAKKLADYVIARWNAAPGHAIGDIPITIQMPLVGLDNAMLALHQETQEAKYLAFMRDMRKVVGWDDCIVLGRWGKVEGHAYTYLAQSVAMMRLDRLEPDPQLLGPTRGLLDFLLNHNGMVITGAIGDHECFHDSQEGTINLGETCATAYALFWLDELMRREGKALYGDLMERVIFNTLFGAQEPNGRHLRYYTALDGPRHYFPTDTYCCPNNYRRGIAALPDHIYYRVVSGLAINLYTESSTDVALEGGLTVKLKQETKYPGDGQVAVHVDPSRAARFPLWLRIPAWCGNPHVTVNGQASESPAVPGSFLVLQREWKPGDQVQLDLPMSARWIKGRQSQMAHVALMHGPQLFCLNRAAHPELKEIDLRLLVIDPQTLEGPVPDDSVRPGGLAFRVKAWKPGSWYPLVKTELTLTLTEFPDPNGEATFFKVPNPGESRFVADELLAPAVKA
jgi:hypothetical protein